MKISVITPTFNSAKTILYTCQSITNQTYKNFEHIIIDNRSSDGTVELIESHYKSTKHFSNLKILIGEDQGISDAFNKGICAATGEIIVILNSDDYYLYDTLFEEVVSKFQNPKILIVHGNMYFEDKLFGSNTRRPLLTKIFHGTPFNHPTCFVNKSLYEKYGLFDLNFRYAMDFEWISRFYDSEDKEKYVYINKTLTLMRGDGVSDLNEKKAQEEVKKALIKNSRWNDLAKLEHKKRVLRLQLKSVLKNLSLHFIIKIWRMLKWRTN